MSTETQENTRPQQTDERIAQGMRFTLLGLLINTLLAIVKVTCGILGRSHALVADGIESTLDIFSSAVVWGGLKLASTPPDRKHPYGHGKAEPLAAAVAALVLIAVGVGIAIQSVREIAAPQHSPAAFTLPVLIGVVTIKETTFRYMIRVGKAVGSTAVKADAWHHRCDAMSSATAFVGISIALLAGEGYESADDWAALVVCGIIAFNGVNLLRLAVGDVMDIAPSAEVEEQLRKLAGGIPGVEEVEMCRVRKSGLAFFIDIHIKVDPGISVRRGHEIAHDVKNALCGSDIKTHDVMVHVEPVGDQGEGTRFSDAQSEPRP